MGKSTRTEKNPFYLSLAGWQTLAFSQHHSHLYRFFKALRIGDSSSGDIKSGTVVYGSPYKR